jgi:hypothetical protein
VSSRITELPEGDPVDGSEWAEAAQDGVSIKFQLGEVIQAAEDVSYDPLASGLAAGDVQAAIDELAARTVPVNTIFGTAYTFALVDAGGIVEGTNVAATTFTIPHSDDVVFPDNIFIEVYQAGAGQITVVADAGVTLRAPNGPKTAQQYSTIALRHRGGDEWVLSGDSDS